VVVHAELAGDGLKSTVSSMPCMLLRGTPSPDRQIEALA
jgi:hypothetical protein